MERQLGEREKLAWKVSEWFLKNQLGQLGWTGVNGACRWGAALAR
jgi:hypothetical protein